MTLLRDGIGPPCTVLAVETLGRVIPLVVLVVIYFLVRSSARNRKVREAESQIQMKRARADSVIEAWEREKGAQYVAPTEELWRSIAVVHFMVVVAPEMFKPFFLPAPRESHQRLARLYGKLGILELAGAPWLDRSTFFSVPPRLWLDHPFGETYQDMTFICRGMAIRSGWRG